MSENGSSWNDTFALWTDWTRSTMNFMQSSATAWQAMLAACAVKDETPRNRDWTSGAAWNALWSGALSPEAIQEMGNAGSFSEVAVEAAKSLIDGCVRFQERMKSLGNKQEGFDYYSIKAQQEVFQSWIDFHEKEIQPLLKIPQVGLTRFYQEKVNQLFDRSNLYQAAVVEFQYLLCRPMETSLQEMQKKLDPGKEGDLSGDFKDYYAAWIKVLESHYMELFRSSEWHKALSRLVEEASNFRMSRNEILMDLMQFLPVPTNKDMDEVYKELYTLKKMVKGLEKKVRQQEQKNQ